MICFNNLSVENGLTFKNLDFNLVNPGLNLVLGKNNVELGSNGSGKSTVFKLLRYMLFGNVGTDLGKDGIINYNHNRKGFYGKLDFSIDSDNYVLTVSRNHHIHKSTSELHKNGKPIQTGLKDVKAYLQTILNFTSIEYDSITFLAQNRTHPFFDSYNVSRRLLFSSLYQLYYDEYLKEIKGSLKNLNSEHTSLLTEITTAESFVNTLPSVSLEELLQVKNKLAAEESVLKKEIARIHTINEKIKAREKLTVSIAELTEELPQINIDKYTKKLDTLKEKETECVLKKKDIANTLNDIEVQKKLLGELEDLGDAANVDESERDLLESNIEKVSNKISNWEKINAVYESIKKLKTYTQEKTDELKTEYNKLSKDIDTYIERKAVVVSMLGAMKNKVCPTCLRDFDNYEQNKQILTNELESITSYISNYNTTKSKYESAITYRSIRNNLPDDFSPEDHETLGDKLTSKKEKYSNKLKDVKKLLRNKDKVIGIKSKLKDNLPTEDSIKLELKELVGTLESVRENISTLNSYIKDYSRKDSELNSLNKQLKDYEGLDECTIDEDEIASKYSSLLIELGECNKNIEMVNTRKKHEKTISDKKEHFLEIDSNVLSYRLLEYCFGPDWFGVRVKNLLDELNYKISRYISILFPYECKQGLSINLYAEGKEIDILGKRGEFDISEFSAGEQQRVAIAFMLALREYLPSKKLTNLLILDEYENHVDKGHEELVLDALIEYSNTNPEISVYVITHNESAQGRPCWNNVYTVCKRGEGDSHIE